MELQSYLVLLVTILLTFQPTQQNDEKLSRRKRNTVGKAIGNRGPPPRRKPAGPNPNIIPPIKLKPGETAQRAPGWKCVKNMKANFSWKTFKSPGYPKFKESQIQCSWIIEAPLHMQVKVAFRDLNLHGFKDACGKQFVQLIDSKLGTSQGRFCGTEVPGDYVSSGTLMRLDLQGDKTVKTYRGFSVSVIAVSKEAPGFRKSRTFSAPVPGTSGSPGGKVNLQSFRSQNDQPTTPPKRSNKKLVYESDLPPTVATTTAASGLGQTVSDGWLAMGGIANQNYKGFTVKPTKSLLVKVGGNNKPITPSGDKPVKFTPGPGRMTIATKSPLNPPDYDEGGYLDPALFSSNYNKVILHEEPKGGISTTTLIILVASCGGGAVIILSLFGLWWYCRKKRKYKSGAKTVHGVATNQQNNTQNNTIGLKEMEARQSELPGMATAPPQNESLHQSLSRHASHRSIHSQNRPPAYSTQQNPNNGMPRNQTHPGHISPGPVPNGHMSPRRMPSNHVSSPNMSHYQLAQQQQRNLSQNMQQRSRHEQNRRSLHQPNMSQHHQQVFSTSATMPRSTSSSRPLPDVPRHRNGGKRGPRYEGDEYYSGGSDDEVNVPEKTLRREYSPWEMEKIKSERKSKLISG